MYIVHVCTHVHVHVQVRKCLKDVHVHVHVVGTGRLYACEQYKCEIQTVSTFECTTSTYLDSILGRFWYPGHPGPCVEVLMATRETPSQHMSLVGYCNRGLVLAFLVPAQSAVDIDVLIPSTNG